MASLNKVQIIGHLGADPETRYMPSGDAVTNIAVATTETWKDKQTGEKKEQTEWHRISFFGKLAEIAGEYLRKGSQVYIEGKLQTRKYTDKDGVEKWATSIKADEMKMLGGKPADGGQQQQRSSQPPAARTGVGYQAPAGGPANRPGPAPQSNFSDMDDDIPF